MPYWYTAIGTWKYRDYEDLFGGSRLALISDIGSVDGRPAKLLTEERFATLRQWVMTVHTPVADRLTEMLVHAMEISEEFPSLDQHSAAASVQRGEPTV